MNLFIVAMVLLQLGAAIYEWVQGRLYGGILWFGCAISNWAILQGVTK